MNTITFQQIECVIQHEPDKTPAILPPLPDTSNWLCPKPVPSPASQTNDGKCIITVKNPAPWQLQQLQSTPEPNTPPPETHQAALLELGKILLKDQDQTVWMSLRKISGQCIKHWVKLPQLNYTIRYLSDWANEFFPRSGEIRGARVKVIYQTRPSESKRPPDLFIQFIRIFPDGSCN